LRRREISPKDHLTNPFASGPSLAIGRASPASQIPFFTNPSANSLRFEKKRAYYAEKVE
jgi:hypothetical protein